jgi:hypothetical protein
MRTLVGVGLLAIVSACAVERTPLDRGSVVEEFQRAARPFQRTETAFVAANASLPLLASEGARVGGVVLHDDELAAAKGTLDRGMVVYRNGDAESIWLQLDRGLEELRVVRRPAATVHARWRFEAPARVIGDHIEAEDTRSEAIVAIDARGVRRAVELRSISGTEIEATVDASDLAFPVVIDPLWTTTSSMTSAHYSHAAVLLTTGDVIISPASYRGEGPITPYGLTQLWESKTATFSALTPSTPHASGGIAPLPGGKALLFAGWAFPGPVLSTAEIFDVATKTWSATAPLSAPRRQMAVAVLGTGVVLSIGGRTTDDSTTAVTITEAYNPATSTWSTRAPLKEARWGAGAAVLSNGKVLVVGGFTATGAAVSGELYDPGADTWSDAGKVSIPSPLVRPLALDDGRAVVVGNKFTVVYDSSTNTWTSTTLRPSSGGIPALARLTNGLVLATGGLDGTASASSADLWNPSTRTWTATTAMATQRNEHVATALPDGRVLITGGKLGATPLSTAEIFALLPNGETCASASECKSAICVDGVCCDDNCVSPCRACNLPGSAGRCSPVTGVPVGARSCAPAKTCTAGACDTSCKVDVDCALDAFCDSTCRARKPLGATCSRPRECASNFCVDGVCCNTVCANTCEACDEPTKAGTCSAIRGTPHGSRPKCETGTGVCSAKSCDGTVVATCNGFAAANGTPCKSGACVESFYFKPSTCDGAGLCVDDLGAQCSPFGCNADGCKTSCANNDDCAAGFLCRSGKCEQGGARCTSNGTGSIGADGIVTSCKGFACGPAGTCLSACGGSSECAGGYLCDVSSKTCVAQQAQDEGGCSLGARGSPSALAMLVLASLLLWRRRALVAALGAAAACSPHRTEDRGTTDDTLGVLSAIPETAAGISRDSLVIEGERAYPSARGALNAWAPTVASAAMHVGLRGAWVELSPEASGDARELMGSTVRFPRALGGIDLVYAVTAQRIEQVFIVRDARARARVVQRVKVSAGHRVAVERDRLLLLDGVSEVILRSEPIVAIDAAGRRRVPRLSLVDDALTMDLDCGDLSPPIVIDPAFTAVPSMSSARLYAASTALGDGSVLVTGGIASPTSTAAPLSTAERFVPATKTWVATGPMIAGRRDHAVVLLSSGRVLAAGGLPAGFAAPKLSTAEIFDPTTNTWTATGSLAAGASQSKLVAIPKGALHIGSAGAEIFDATAGTFSAGGTMITTGRSQFGAAKLPSGKVLVVGGRIPGPTTTSSAEIYDPATNTWSAAATPSSSRTDFATTTLASGKIFVVGGFDVAGAVVPFAEVYDEATNTWTKTATMIELTVFAAKVTAAALTDRVLVGAGHPSMTTTQVWFPARDQWARTSPIGWAPDAIVSLGGGRALIAGGIATAPSGSYATSTAEVFEPQPTATTCPGAGDCTSGFCVDGVCCETACDKTCEACDAMGSIGTCTNVTGAPRASHGSCSPYLCKAGACATSCAADSECVGTICEGSVCGGRLENGRACTTDARCASGHCVDGLCCDSACTDVCAACDVPGREGACSPASGEPHGARKCVDASMGNVCKAPLCDGTKDITTCVAFPNAATKCAAAKCDGNRFTPAATCDGAGGCATPMARECKPYGCSEAGCLTTCSASQPCVDGFDCIAERCLPKGKKAQCTPDNRSSVGVDDVTRACGAYLCVSMSGLCGSTCTATTECSAGFICDPKDHACVNPSLQAATEEADGGCSTTRRPAAIEPYWLVLLVFVARAKVRK